MWLSENGSRHNLESTAASLELVASETHELLRPANILRLPKSGETQLLLLCSDGSCIRLGVVGGDEPEELEAGEVYISTDNAAITIKNNGAVSIEGAVSITGSLKINGVTVE